MQIRSGRNEKTLIWEGSSGLHRKAIPAAKLELGAISCLAFNVCFWHLADVPRSRPYVRLWRQSGHTWSASLVSTSNSDGKFLNYHFSITEAFTKHRQFSLTQSAQSVELVLTGALSIVVLLRAQNPVPQRGPLRRRQLMLAS